MVGSHSAALRRVGFEAKVPQRKRHNSRDKDAERLREQIRAPLVDEERGVVQRIQKRVQDLAESRETKIAREAAAEEECRAGRNRALHSIGRRFQYYAGDGKACMGRTGFAKLVFDALGPVTDARLQQLVALADTDHSDAISFAEFVSFASLGNDELGDIALELRASLKASGRGKTLSAAFRKISDGGKISPKRLQDEVMARLDQRLTPGELGRLGAMLGHTLDGMRQFMRLSPKAFRRRWADDRCVTGLDLTFGGAGKRAKKLEALGYQSVQPPLSDTVPFAKPLVLWVRRESLKNEDCESDEDEPATGKDSDLDDAADAEDAEDGSESSGSSSSSSEEEASDEETKADSDGAGSESSGSSASDGDEDKGDVQGDAEPARARSRSSQSASKPRFAGLGFARGRGRASSTPSMRNASPSKRRLGSRWPVVHFEIAKGNRNAGLVAEGYECIETPLSSGLTNARRHFLWVKADRHAEQHGNADKILEFAITFGKSKLWHSEVWSPPCRGFKLCEHRFAGSLGRDVFLWYRKADATYAREGLLARAKHRHLRKGATGLRAGQAANPQALERRVRQLVRERVVARRADTTGKRSAALASFDPVQVFEHVAPRRKYLSKREFVRALLRFNLQLSSHELALIFDRLDTHGTNRVHRDDVVEFFELSDREIESLLIQIQGYVRRAKRSGESIYQMFSRLDENGDGKLSASEFHALLQKMGIIAAPSEVQRLVDRLDADQSGFVEVQEFADFVKSTSSFLSAMSKRIVGLNSNVRAAARALHRVAERVGQVGQPSGRLETKLNVEYAWERLVTNLRGNDTQPDVLDIERLRAIAGAKRIRLRREEARALLCAIDPKSDEQGGVSFAAFAAFVRDHRPLKDEKGQASSGDGYGDAGAGAASFLGALRDFHADLNALALEQGGEVKKVFALLFGDKSKGKVSCADFEQALSKLGALRAFSGRGDAERLCQHFDRDQDGVISWRDLGRFIRQPCGRARRSEVDGSDCEYEFSEGDDGDCAGHGAGAHTDEANAMSWSRRNQQRREYGRRGPVQASLSDDEEDEWPTQSATSPSKRVSKAKRAAQNRDAFEKRHRSASQDGANKRPVWWLKNDAAKDSGDGEVDYSDEFVSRLFENDLRKSWIVHFDAIKGGGAKGGGGEGASELVHEALETLDLNALCAAVEDAVRRNGKPLRLGLRFARHDPDATGLVSKRHFKRVLEKAGVSIPESEHAPLTKLLMDNEAGRVNYTLFCKLLADSSEMQPRNVEQVQRRIAEQFKGIDYLFIFEGFDRKGDGTIHRQDLSKVLRLCDVAISPSDWRAIKPRVLKEGRINYLALKEIIETWPAAKAAKEAAGSVLDLKGIRAAELRLFRALARESSARCPEGDAGSRMKALATVDLSAALEALDLAGLGTIPAVDFVAALGKLVAKLGLRKWLGPAVLRQIASKYQCIPAAGRPSAEFRVDYVAFCDAFNASALGAREQERILFEVSAKLRAAARKFQLSYEGAMQARDHERCGFVSRYDFRRALRHELALEITEPDLLALMELYDTRGDGFVDYAKLCNELALEPGAARDPELARRHAQQIAARVRERALEDPCFDLRRLFRYHSGGAAHIGREDLRRLILALGVYLTDEDVARLCPSRRLALADFMRLADAEEEEMDEIARRCHARVTELDREGDSFWSMCARHREPELAEPSIRPRLFRQCAREAGLPLSAEQLDRLLARFTDPSSNLVSYGNFLDMVRARGSR